MWFCGKLYVWICLEWFSDLIVCLCVVLYFVCVFCWNLLYMWVCNIFIVFFLFLIWDFLFWYDIIVFVGKCVKWMVDIVVLIFWLLGLFEVNVFIWMFFLWMFILIFFVLGRYVIVVVDVWIWLFDFVLGICWIWCVLFLNFIFEYVFLLLIIKIIFL